MAAPIVFGLGSLLASALSWLVSSLGTLFFVLMTSLLGRAVFGGIVFLLVGYFATTKIEAASWMIGLLSAGDGFLSASVVFPALGSVIQALRLDDIILVYINAYATGFTLRWLWRVMGVGYKGSSATF